MESYDASKDKLALGRSALTPVICALCARLYRSPSRGGHALSARPPLHSQLAQHGWTAARRCTGRQACRRYPSAASHPPMPSNSAQDLASICALLSPSRVVSSAASPLAAGSARLCWRSSHRRTLSPILAPPTLQPSPARREGLWSGRVAARYANVRSPPTQHCSLRSFYMGGGR